MSKTIAMVLFMVVFLPAVSAVPELPEAYYGSAELDGSNSGAIFVAAVHSQIVVGYEGVLSGDYGGPYGTDEKLLVQGDIENGEIIEFYVSGFKAAQTDTFQSGTITNLDLAADKPTELFQINIVCAPGFPVTLNHANLIVEINCSTPEIVNVNEITTLLNFFSGASVPSGLTDISNVFEISVSGNIEIFATIPYSDTGIIESSVAPYMYDGFSWVVISESDIVNIDTNANTIKFRVPSGSTPYTLFGSSQDDSDNGGSSGGGGSSGSSSSSDQSSGGQKSSGSVSGAKDSGGDFPSDDQDNPNTPEEPEDEAFFSAITGAVIGALGTLGPFIIIIFIAGLIAASIVIRMRNRSIDKKGKKK